MNKEITYITVRQQGSLQANDRIAAKEGKSRIPGGAEGIRKNLSMEAYSARDGSRHDQRS